MPGLQGVSRYMHACMYARILYIAMHVNIRDHHDCAYL